MPLLLILAPHCFPLFEVGMTFYMSEISMNYVTVVDTHERWVHWERIPVHVGKRAMIQY